MKRLVVPAAIVAAFAAGTFANAATGWHVFATGSDSGQYGAFANANADVLHPKALAVRATKAATVSWTFDCDSGDIKAAANAVLLVDVAKASKCSLTADANTESAGTVRIQLLRR
jgi:hypothetical protein